KETATRLIPILLRDTEIPALLRHIKYLDFRNEADFDDRFVELYDALFNISDRPPLGIDNVDTVRRKIRLRRYQDAAEVMAVLEEAAARIAGESRAIIPGSNELYPERESVGMFREAFANLQRIKRERSSFSQAAFKELSRTVAMIETMNLDFD